MRVTTVFNRILAIPGATVAGVELSPGGIVVHLRPRFRLLHCSCGQRLRGRYDQRIRRWRHIDIAGMAVWLQAGVRRLRCPKCGVRTEQVPWAGPGARHSNDLEHLVLWLAQRMDRTAVAALVGISWKAVTAIISRGVRQRLDPSRLDGLRRIGVDEVRFRYRRFLTMVVDHDTGSVVWVAEGKNAAALEDFYAAIGAAGRAAIEAVSMDFGKAYQAATSQRIPEAQICIDPFHVVQLANRAVVSSLRWAKQTGTLQRGVRSARLHQALQKPVGRLSEAEHALVAGLRRERSVAWRAYEIKEDLRGLYSRVDPAAASAYLTRWLRRVARSRIPPMIAFARLVAQHFEQIVASVQLGITNARLEGTASKVRLINHRGYGHHSIAALAAMIYLCCGAINLPQLRHGRSAHRGANRRCADWRVTPSTAAI